jgi:hypothetical protein
MSSRRIRCVSCVLRVALKDGKKKNKKTEQYIEGQAIGCEGQKCWFLTQHTRKAKKTIALEPRFGLELGETKGTSPYLSWNYGAFEGVPMYCVARVLQNTTSHQPLHTLHVETTTFRCVSHGRRQMRVASGYNGHSLVQVLYEYVYRRKPRSRWRPNERF